MSPSTGGATGGADQPKSATGAASTGGASNTGGGVGAPAGATGATAGPVGGSQSAGSGGSSTQLPPGAWWDPQWQRRRAIVVTGPQHEPLSDFPVPVRLTAANFDFQSAAPSGADLRAMDVAGNPLNLEIESWTPTQAIVWVRLPRLPATGQSATIYLYDGNAGASPLSADFARGVWSADAYLGVWHLADSRDSGPLGIVGEASGHEFTSGVLGGGLLVHQASRGHLALPQNLTVLGGLSVVTFSGWVEPHAGADEQNGIIAIGGDLRFDSAGHPGFSIGFDGPNLVTMAIPMRGPTAGPYDTEFRSTNSQLTQEQWVHIAVQMDISSGATLVYQNGTLVDSKSATPYGTTQFDATYVAHASALGSDCVGGHDFAEATFDEFRLQKASRSPAWFEAEFRSMSSPTFAVVGPVEVP